VCVCVAFETKRIGRQQCPGSVEIVTGQVDGGVFELLSVHFDYCNTAMVVCRTKKKLEI
jgi:hypothetical protein